MKSNYLPYIIVLFIFMLVSMLAMIALSTHGLIISTHGWFTEKKYFDNRMIMELKKSYMDTVSNEVFDAFYNYVLHERLANKENINVDKIRLRVMLGIFTQTMNKYPEWAIAVTNENTKISREFLNLAAEVGLPEIYIDEHRVELMNYHDIVKSHESRNDIITALNSLHAV